MNRALNVAEVLLDTCKHLHTKTFFIFTVFVSMSRFVSIGLFMPYDLFFIFIFTMINHNNLTRTGTLCRHFLEYFLLFLEDSMNKECEYFPDSKSSASGSSLAIVLHTKKRVLVVSHVNSFVFAFEPNTNLKTTRAFEQSKLNVLMTNVLWPISGKLFSDFYRHT